MTFFNPPHEVRDSKKLAALVESFRVGRPVPPVAVMGVTAFTGSHRIAAHQQAWRLSNSLADGWDDSPEPTLETIEVSEEDYRAACDLLGIEYHDEEREHARWCAALYAVTDDDSLKAALADQRDGYEDSL